MTMREKVMQALKETPLAPWFARIEQEESARATERAQRTAWATEYAALEAERTKVLPGLLAEEQRQLDEVIALVKARHQALLEAAGRRLELDHRTARRQAWLERELRRTAAAHLRPSGPFADAAQRMLAHLGRHLQSDLRVQRQELNLLQRDHPAAPAGSQLSELIVSLKARVELAEACEPIVATVQGVMADLTRLELADVADVPPRLKALVAKLPRTCPCGVVFATLPRERRVGPGVEASPMPDLEALAAQTGGAA
ncbi:MAG: hypothetical protein AB7R55_13020 [Gemmatimonadales bacterium]